MKPAPRQRRYELGLSLRTIRAAATTTARAGIKAARTAAADDVRRAHRHLALAVAAMKRAIARGGDV